MEQELIARLRAAFEEHRDGERAAAASAYMRDQFEFYGIPEPAQRIIAREAAAGLAAPSQRQLERVARACWREPQREWQYFACGYARRHISVVDATFLDVTEWLITTKSWWDTVDALATHVVGGLVAAHPALRSVIDGWIGSPNMWLARTAILHQLRYRERTDRDRLFRYCLKRSGDREFFIRKAIGWALREYSKTNAEAVVAFVREHDGVLAPLSRTEALKWLRHRGSPVAG